MSSSNDNHENPSTGNQYDEYVHPDEDYLEDSWEEYDATISEERIEPLTDDFYYEGEDDNSGRYLEYSETDLEPPEPKKVDIMWDLGGRMGRRAFIADDEYLDLLEAEEMELEMRDYQPVRFRRAGKTGLLGGLMYAVFVISVSIILACIAWMAASDVLALNKAEHISMITISKPVNIDAVTNQLKDSGLIEYKALFKLYAKISDADEKINPGTYELSTVFDYRALVQKMQTGSEAQQTTKLTFPEGFTTKQMFERLEENNICSVEELELAAATYNYSYSFLENLPKGEPNRLEGYMFPDTYEFYEGEQASSVINKFLYVFYLRMTKEILQDIENSGHTLDEIINIASMIEREAGNNDERAIIASVIYNRLRIGMTLGIDATVRYVLPSTGSLQMTQAELVTDSPYNTHIYTGLPPTPISCPGMASIKAAISPATTNYIFYALDTEIKAHRFFTNDYDFNVFTSTQNYN